MGTAIGATRLLFIGLLLAATTVDAKRGDEDVGLSLADTTTHADFQAQRAAIDEALAEPEQYSEMSRSSRSSLQASLDAIAARLEASGSLAAMSDAERDALAADAEDVNEMLETARHDSRIVCTREATMGSNRTRRVCLTVAQRRRQSEGAQRLRED
ncbi:MAG TPA: hypothetical protein VFQ84_08465 [Arenimonas sp.]|uniref:hypothetical protein n=1 Tax=Arenimonas sp. TaxID=1872635 RepID=UPI002D80F871|nr:hypothetical protein [Arenimonas sp.]HEU0153362.1 hypothetical protein [Arenimonas sp.]